jgi:type I restriction enzyme S subunit
MKRWQTVELGKLVEEERGISYGIVQPGKHMAAGVPIVRVSDVRRGRINTEAPLRVSPTVEAAYLRTRLGGGELLITVVGTIGETAIVPSKLRGWNVARAIAVIPVKREVGAYWIRLALTAPAAREMMKSHLNTTVQPTLNLGVVSKLPILLPPENERSRIIEIVGAYDSLIELNQQRIALLEEMGRRVFEEWFVHSSSSTLIADGLDEPVPEGWKLGKIGDLVEFKSGFPFKSSSFTPGGKHRIVTIRNVQDGNFYPATGTYIDDFPEKLPQHCRLKDGDILISLTGNVGRVCVVYDGPFLLNQRVALLSPVDVIDKAFVYWLFRQPPVRTKLELTSNGVAQQNLSPIIAAKLPLLIPTHDDRIRFSTFATPIVDEIVLLESTNSRLAHARDLVLSHLISSALTVSDAEHGLEAVA